MRALKQADRLGDASTADGCVPIGLSLAALVECVVESRTNPLMYQKIGVRGWGLRDRVTALYGAP